MISLQGKTNFFEKRVGDYQKVCVVAIYYTHQRCPPNPIKDAQGHKHIQRVTFSRKFSCERTERRLKNLCNTRLCGNVVTVLSTAFRAILVCITEVCACVCTKFPIPKKLDYSQLIYHDSPAFHSMYLPYSCPDAGQRHELSRRRRLSTRLLHRGGLLSPPCL
jgi:hypothetical protein